MDNLATFCDCYERNLIKARTEKPDQYAWPASELPAVIGRMHAAIAKGSFNKDGIAFKTTCKELGIPHTYTAIRGYIGAC